jgi:hypothetical protein
MTTTGRHLWAPLALAAIVALAGCASEQSPGGSAGAASCAAVLDHDGARYVGHGDLKRDPDTTGRMVDAVVPGCDDTGGLVDPEPAEQVRVAELADVPLGTAVLHNGTVYLREGAELPAEARPWFTAPDCARSGEFELTGDWIGVTSKHDPRFDGDLRPPYRLELQVEDGPEEYVGSTVMLRATVGTDPRPGVPEVKASLWDAEPLVATVRCDDGRLLALSLEVPSAG